MNRMSVSEKRMLAMHLTYQLPIGFDDAHDVLELMRALLKYAHEEAPERKTNPKTSA